MQEKEQRRQPDIEIMFSYPDSGAGEECCDLCGHMHQHGEAIECCDLCGHVHQHREEIARFSAIPGDNASFQICQDLEQYMDGDVDDILEALIEIIEENVDAGTSIEELEDSEARIKELRLLIGGFKYPTPAEYREALEAHRQQVSL
jgi:hypothetical protein